MKNEVANFGESVGSALEQAAIENIHPMDAILCLGGYIDVAIRCAGGTKNDSGKVFDALSSKYGIGQQKYAIHELENCRQSSRRNSLDHIIK